MTSQHTRAALLTGVFLLGAGAAYAAPPEWAMNDGVRTTLPPGLQNNNAANGRVHSVPIPATTLMLFGAGLVAIPWLRGRRRAIDCRR